jgi:alginate O-acetyltransferase complex protein AlgJ
MTRKTYATAIYGALAALYLGYSAVFNAEFLWGHGRPFAMPVLDVVRGEAASQFEAGYRKAALYRDGAVELFGALRYDVFGEGRRGVVVGGEGWLFTAEEFETAADADMKIAQAMTYIGGVRARVSASGSELIVALVPAKADVYSEHLGHFRLPDEPAQRYAKVLALLYSQHIAAPDLRGVLRAEKSKDQAYLKTDTHWTPEGAIAAAGAIALAEGGQGAAPRRMAEIDVDGDLRRFLGGAGGGKETISQYATATPVAADAGDLFGNEAVHNVLVGTSYSANQNWGFENALKAALNGDVLNVAEQGEGPFKPMQAYLESSTFRDMPPKLVIWEIPVRFMLSYTPAGAKNPAGPADALSASR